MTHEPKNNRNARISKSDRLLSSGASKEEIAAEFSALPFDRAMRAMNDKWGDDRIFGLVTTAMAEKFGKALGLLNEAIESADSDAARQHADNCIKGLAAMDAMAEAAGHATADPTVWEYDCEGFKFGIMADNRSWDSVKAARPELVLYTMREVARALMATGASGALVEATKDAFPKAEIKKITMTKPPVDYANGGDAIQF